MKEFSDKVRSGEWKEYTGKVINPIVNLGIGGTNLGAVMVAEALKPYAKRDLTAHFVLNIDGTHIAETLKLGDPETTLFIIASKIRQGNVESNGKSATKKGDKVDYQTGPIIWGASGTNGQHSFDQLVHQGAKLIPADFLTPAPTHKPIDNSKHHRILLSNFFAQPEELAFGKTEEKVKSELQSLGIGLSNNPALVQSKIFAGNKPSTSIMFPLLMSVVALYEHKIFVQGVIWGINSFDQWGVELGKVLAKNILKQLEKPEDVTGHDSSRAGLVRWHRKNMKEWVGRWLTLRG